jgi:hypothetical protein
MSWRLAKSLIRLREQVNAQWPTRDKTSDGSIGDDAHKHEKSDHNPNAQGVVTAIDIDADLSDTENVGTLVASLFLSHDPRIKYLIFNRKITARNANGIISTWIPYHGANAHKKHLHISVKSDAKFYDNDSDWRI